MKKNKISKNWLIKKHKDPFFKKSQIEGYRSRSSFKLIEMDKKFKLLNKKSYLLDFWSELDFFNTFISYYYSSSVFSEVASTFCVPSVLTLETW